MRSKILVVAAFFLAVSANAQTYLISFNGTGASSTVNSVRVENLTSGLTQVINGNDVLRLTGTTGINSDVINQVSELKIFPNPMTDFTFLQISPPEAGNATFSVYDMTGKIVTRVQRYLDKTDYEFRLSGLKNGFYLVSIRGNTYQYSGKLLCDSNAEGQVEFDMISNNKQAVAKPETSHTKGTQATVDMSYSTGDRLKFTGSSGIYSTIITDIPASDKLLTFNFVACTDGDNNNYPVVKINNQIWMAENLKSLKYLNSDLIGTTTPATLDINAESTPKYQWAYDGNESNANTSGRLYTWYAITDSRRVCPAGWHVPTDEDLTALTDYLTNNGYGYQGSGNDIGKSLATTLGWYTDPTSGNVGNSPSSNNSSGFTGVPSGYRSYNGTFLSIGSGGFWWCFTEASATTAIARAIRSYNNYVDNYYNTKKNGYSVRCLKD